jgi:hypothetical protein
LQVNQFAKVLAETSYDMTKIKAEALGHAACLNPQWGHAKFESAWTEVEKGIDSLLQIGGPGVDIAQLKQRLKGQLQKFDLYHQDVYGKTPTESNYTSPAVRYIGLYDLD